MTIHVTVHDTRGGAGGHRDWEVELVKPKRGRLMRNESDETGHRVEFELPAGSRQLVFQRRDAGGDRAEEVTAITLDLEAGKDSQEFELSDPVRGDGADKATATRDEADRTEAETEQEGGETAEAEAEAEETEETEEGGLHDLAQHMNQQLVRIWMTVDDLAYRVSELERGFAAHLALHSTIPIPGQGPGEEPGEGPGEEPPAGLEAAVVAAVQATTQVRDGFLDAAETFAGRLGLEPGADGTTVAGRTLEALTLAANAANSAITVYQNEPAPSPGSEDLALVSFVGKVQTAGQFYADTVDQVALAAARTFDTGERSAYTDLVASLRGGTVGPAIDQLRSFDVGQLEVDETAGERAGAVRTERQGVPS
jgi:hypothetical protein